MIVTCFLWGLNAVVTKNALGDAPEAFRTFVFNGLRIPAAALLLLVAAKASGRPAGISRKDFPLVAMVAFFGMFLFMMTFILGVSLTTVSNAGVINASTPLFIILVSVVTGIERPTGRTVLGMIVGMAGMLALARREGGFSLNAGDIFMLASCLAWAVHTVYGKRVVRRYNPIAATAWIYLLTSVFQLPFVIMQLPEQSWAAVSAANWLNLGISCVGSLFLANTLYYYAVERIGPSRVGVYTNLTPVFTLVLAALMRGEEITSGQVAGLVVIISGIVISNYRGSGIPAEKA